MHRTAQVIFPVSLGLVAACSEPFFVDPGPAAFFGGQPTSNLLLDVDQSQVAIVRDLQAERVQVQLASGDGGDISAEAFMVDGAPARRLQIFRDPNQAFADADVTRRGDVWPPTPLFSGAIDQIWVAAVLGDGTISLKTRIARLRDVIRSGVEGVTAPGRTTVVGAGTRPDSPGVPATPAFAVTAPDGSLTSVVLRRTWSKRWPRGPNLPWSAAVFDREAEQLWVVETQAGKAAVPQTRAYFGEGSWSAPSVRASFSSRDSVAVAWSEARGEMVLMGGKSANTVHEDTWVWRDGEWADQSGSVGSPGPRFGAAMAYDPAEQVILLFGGQAVDGRRLDDTWRFDGARWRPVNLLPEQRPPGRVSGRMVYDRAQGRMLLYGGLGAASEGPLTSTWLWDGAAWSRADGPASGPGGRTEFGMAFDEEAGQVVLHGGMLPDDAPGSAPLSDTWTWNGAAWSQLDAEGPPRQRHHLVFDTASQRTLLVGGAGPNGCESAIFALHDGAWRAVDNAAETPGCRTDHAMVFDARLGEVVLLGGSTEPGAWTWDGARWARLDAPTQLPARFGLAAAWDADGETLVAFGGETPEGALSEDTWLHDGQDWRLSTAQVRPSRRRDAVMAYHGADRRMVLFGGSQGPGRFLGDTWTWGADGWRRQTPSLAPAPRFGGGMSYDAAEQVLVMFGGIVDEASESSQTWRWSMGGWTSSQNPAGLTAGLGQRLVYDAGQEQTILFGGTNVPESWAESDGAWSRLEIEAPPSMVSERLALAYDLERRVIVAYGALDGPADTWEAELRPLPEVQFSGAFRFLERPNDATLVAHAQCALSEVQPGDQIELTYWNGRSWGVLARAPVQDETPVRLSGQATQAIPTDSSVHLRCRPSRAGIAARADHFTAFAETRAF